MFENKNQELTPISTLGEFGLIKHLTQFSLLRILLQNWVWEMMQRLSMPKGKRF